MKKALVTGINGQDGSYLADFLIGMGYEVHGIIRRSSSFNTQRIEHLFPGRDGEPPRLLLHYGDLLDAANLNRLVSQVHPDEIYNLGAQSHVMVSFELPEYTSEVNGVGTLRLLEAVRQTDTEIRFYQASSSELFGKAAEIPQNEATPFRPRSPYAAAKLLSYWTAVNYREAYDIFACNGILFNHESPRRGGTFVTRKITTGIGNILCGKQDRVVLGNLDAKRDWGFAGDYVKAMWMMLQQKEPDDYVIATGETHSVREFCGIAFGYAGIELEWEGEGLDEKGLDAETGAIRVSVDKRYFRPTEVDLLLGNFAKARDKLGWKPEVGFRELVLLMLESDLKACGIQTGIRG